MKWRAVAKDGADLPPHQAIDQRASFSLRPGETFDFEIVPAANQTRRLQITTVGTVAERWDARARGVALPRTVIDIPLVVR